MNLVGWSDAAPSSQEYYGSTPVTFMIYLYIAALNHWSIQSNQLPFGF
jgi:hypothetical protein